VDNALHALAHRVHRTGRYATETAIFNQSKDALIAAQLLAIEGLLHALHGSAGKANADRSSQSIDQALQGIGLLVELFHWLP